MTTEITDAKITANPVRDPVDRIGAPFRVGIVGGGVISEQHMMALSNLRDVQVVGITDLSPSLAKYTAKRFGIPEWFTDYRQMLADRDCDVVHVLTPPATHQRIAHDCLSCGADVLVEKPIALSRPAFHSLWNHAEACGQLLMESQNYRFNEPVLRMQHLLESGQLGEVQEIEVRMCLPIASGGRLADRNFPHASHQLPAGALHEFITHLAYLFLKFLPGQSFQSVDSVHAAWRSTAGNSSFLYDDLDALILSSHIRGRIRFSAQQLPASFQLSVRGSRGHAIAELFQSTILCNRIRTGGQHLTPCINAICGAGTLVRDGVSGLWRKIGNRTAYEGLHRFLEKTYTAWAIGKQAPVGYVEMDETLSLIDALLAKENRI